jgi:hypothetical protein
VNARGVHLSIRAAAVIAALITVAVAVVAITVVHAHRAWVMEAFRQRGLSYATTFADSVEAWLAAGNHEMVATGVRLLSVAGVPFVRIVHDDGSLAEQGWEDYGGTLTPLAASPDAPTASLHRGIGQGPVLDVAIPFRGLWDPSLTGHVRIGLDAGAALGTIVATTWLIAGSSAAFVLLLWGTGFVLARRRLHLPAALRGTEPFEDDPPGDRLALDEGRALVRWDGTVIRLPPKPFALLRLLASERGRVFPDRTILEEVWPDSPYADAKDVKQCIYLLRRRLARVDGEAAALVENLPGFGYRLRPSRPDDPDVTAR